MSMLVRLLPGLVAAAAALLAMELVSLFGAASTAFRIAVFFVTYLVVAILADRAMATYGKGRH